MKFLTIILSLLLTFNTFAEEHSVGSFTGTNIDLTAYDHSFAGRIKDFTAFGWVDEANFTSHLTIRKYEKTTEASFSKSEKGIGGVITTENSTVEVLFKGYDKDNLVLSYEINGQVVEVAITYEDFVDGHFVNPTYTTTLDGVEHQFKLVGEACVGLSLHYNMLLLAALHF